MLIDLVTVVAVLVTATTCAALHWWSTTFLLIREEAKQQMLDTVSTLLTEEQTLTKRLREENSELRIEHAETLKRIATQAQHETEQLQRMLVERIQ